MAISKKHVLLGIMGIALIIAVVGLMNNDLRITAVGGVIAVGTYIFTMNAKKRNR